MKFLLLCFLGGGSQLWIFTKIKFSREIYAFFCSQKNERFFIHQQTTLKSVKFMIFSSQKIPNFNLDKKYKKSQKKGISNPEKCVDINIPDE